MTPKLSKEGIMYAAIRRYKVQPGSGEEIARRAREGFVPLISKAAGFVAYYGVVGPNDEVVTVSIFENQAGAEQSVNLAAGWVRENLAQYIQGPPEVLTGDVGWSATK